MLRIRVGPCTFSFWSTARCRPRVLPSTLGVSLVVPTLQGLSSITSTNPSSNLPTRRAEYGQELHLIPWTTVLPKEQHNTHEVWGQETNRHVPSSGKLALVKVTQCPAIWANLGPFRRNKQVSDCKEAIISGSFHWRALTGLMEGVAGSYPYSAGYLALQGAAFFLVHVASTMLLVLVTFPQYGEEGHIQSMLHVCSLQVSDWVSWAVDRRIAWDGQEFYLSFTAGVKICIPINPTFRNGPKEAWIFSDLSAR